jgi:hypothetical protein
MACGRSGDVWRYRQDIGKASKEGKAGKTTEGRKEGRKNTKRMNV